MKLPRPFREPNFRALMTTSPALASWPPDNPDPRDEYQVGTPDKAGASWRAVATGYAIRDVWDLIWYNFRTEEPRRVNFYMHRYIGCWQSNDGKNFSFKESKPGLVYIPPLGFKRPTGDPLAKLVVSMLRPLVGHYPYLVYNGAHISRTHLLAVIEAIRTGQIKVKPDPEALRSRNANAGYSPFLKKILVRRPFLDTPANRMALVHEATHAIIDMQNKRLDVWEDEAIAYVAEMLSQRSWGAFVDRSSDIHWMAAKLADEIMTNERGKTAIRLNDYDRVIEAKDRSGKTIHYNPFLRLKEMIKHDGTYIEDWWRSNLADEL